jgi:hypothetical protein
MTTATAQACTNIEFIKYTTAILYRIFNGKVRFGDGTLMACTKSHTLFR